MGKLEEWQFQQESRLSLAAGIMEKAHCYDPSRMLSTRIFPVTGREKIATLSSAVKIRAEDCRSAWEVDISPFMNDLPMVKDTSSFSTLSASGSTSQAVNIIESIECESKLLLMDEDTCATNFMIRDSRMQALVHSDKEPITPFIDRVEEINNNFGISVIIVMGGSGDYFESAHQVISMEWYKPQLVTNKAKEIAASKPTGRQKRKRNTILRN